MKPNKNIVVLIPAAGESTRMRKVKQNLPWGKTTLLNHAIAKTNKLKVIDSFVVIGANADEVNSSLDKGLVRIIKNENWQLGLGKSIAVGTEHILSTYPDTDGILVLLPDQPLVKRKYLSELIEQFIKGNHGIVASSYGHEKIGVPAIFGSDFFRDLKQLNEDYGAREIINNNSNNVLALNAKEQLKDIDTEDQYRSILEANRQ